MASSDSVGVGITIKIMENGQCIVLNTIPGGSAHECRKITPGDHLLGVLDREKSNDIMPTSGLTFNEIKDLIVGPRRSKISLKMRRSQGSVETETYVCDDLVRESVLPSMSHTSIDRGSSPVLEVRFIMSHARSYI
jgi:C-terminal processing protease CtpA/Prc